MRALLVLLLAAPAAASAAEEARYTLRLATVAPKGSSWAHEIDDLVATVAKETNGEVKIKVYYGGSAGNEVQVAERIERGQLDGAISGGWLCRRVMPSMRVLGLIGVFQNRDEATHVMSALGLTLEKEAEQAGFVLFGTAGVGSVVIFSREPITSMASLRKTKLWRWEGEEVELLHGGQMGLSAEPSSLEDAAEAYEDGRVDGFFAVPMAALAFQWWARTRYVTDLKTGFLQGCLLVTRGSVDALPSKYRDVVRSATASLVLRFDEVGKQEEDKLLGGVFERRGLKPVEASSKFRAEFFDAAREAREALGEKLVPKALLTQVLELLADYRAEHAKQ
jgi:TRAP-type C4-dicarboxylate transport system substrate-binding protein